MADEKAPETNPFELLWWLLGLFAVLILALWARGGLGELTNIQGQGFFTQPPSVTVPTN